MADKIQFWASFPPIQSALKSGPDGARVQLDIPKSEMPAIVRLHGCFGQLLRVTIEAVDRSEAEIASWEASLDG